MLTEEKIGHVFDARKVYAFFLRKRYNVGLQRGKSVSLVIRPLPCKDLHLFLFLSPIQCTSKESLCNKLEFKITSPCLISVMCNTIQLIEFILKNKNACIYGARH